MRTRERMSRNLYTVIEGRTNPSVAAVLESDCEVIWLDVEGHSRRLNLIFQ